MGADAPWGERRWVGRVVGGLRWWRGLKVVALAVGLEVVGK